MVIESETTKETSGLSLFRDRNFLWLWLAYVISNLGDTALSIALPVTVYNATNSKTALGFSLIFGTLPVLLFGLAGGVFADRWNRRRTMITADIGRAFAVLLLLLIPSAHFHAPGTPFTALFTAHDRGLVYAVSFLVASFSCFFSPSRQSLLPALIPREKLLQANGLMLSANQATLFLGPALGGLLISWFHPRGVFIFDAATFVASGLFVRMITNVTVAPGKKSARGVSGLWRDAGEGLHYVWNSRVLRPSLLLLALVVVGGSVYNTLEYPFVRDIWHGDSTQFTILACLSGVAAVLTGLATVGPIRSAPPVRLIAPGFAGMGLTGLVFAFSTNIYLGGAMVFLMTVANSISNLGQVTLFLATAPNNIQGRVSATVGLVNKISMSVGAALVALLTSLFPADTALRPIFSGFGVSYVLCALLAWFLLGRLPRSAFAPPAPPPVPDPPRNNSLARVEP